MNKNSVLTGIIAFALCVPVWAFDGPPPHSDRQQGFEQSNQNAGQSQKRGKHGKRGKGHEKLKQMSEEERAAFKAEVKEKWEALSDQEKDQFKAKVEARKKAHEERRLVRQYGMHLLMQQEKAGE